MTAAGSPRAALHWFARHLVASGFLAFAAVGWIYREQILSNEVDWRGLAEVLLGSDSANKSATRHAAIPNGAFRPAYSDARSAAVEPGPEGLLAQARQAFWVGDPAAADRLYREYLLSHPESIDGHGELGNLLVNIGRPAEARPLYLRTIRLLEQSDRATEAAQLRNLVSTLETEDESAAPIKQ